MDYASPLYPFGKPYLIRTHDKMVKQIALLCAYFDHCLFACFQFVLNELVRISNYLNLILSVVVPTGHACACGVVGPLCMPHPGMGPLL